MKKKKKMDARKNKWGASQCRNLCQVSKSKEEGGGREGGELCKDGAGHKRHRGMYVCTTSPREVLSSYMIQQ